MFSSASFYEAPAYYFELIECFELMMLLYDMPERVEGFPIYGC